MTIFGFDIEDAAIVSTIKKWHSAGRGKLGRTILQKLIYFVKSKGVPLSFDYELYHYGPFCQELSERVDWLQVDNVIDDKGSGNESNYVPGSRADEVTENHLDVQNEILIDQVVNSFLQKTPRDMELLATVHFVKKSGGLNKDISRTLREVRRTSRR